MSNNDKYCISLKLSKTTKTSMFMLFFIVNILQASSLNTINLHSLNDFIDNDESIEICGDKYLTKTKSGEVLLSIDMGNNWTKLNIGKISKIISFESTNLNKRKEKFKSGNKYNLEFLENLLSKINQKENLENQIKLSLPEENIVFINEDGKILLSKNCGFEFLNLNQNKFLNEFNKSLEKNVIAKDFVFHPYDQNKGIVIAFTDQGDIFEDAVERSLIEVFLTENFGKTFKKIQSFNNQDLKKYSDFAW